MNIIRNIITTYYEFELQGKFKGIKNWIESLLYFVYNFKTF